MKGYNLWNPITKKTISNQDVVFREVKEFPRQEVNPMEREPEKIEFELEGEESNSTEEVESEEEEPHTPILRRSSQERRKPERYSHLNFCSHFSFSITDDEPRNVKEVVDSWDTDIWKKEMVEEMGALDKNEAWNLVKLPSGRKFDACLKIS